MPHAASHRLLVIGRWSLAFAVCFAFFNALGAFAQSADEAGLRALTEKFFAAYQSEDLDGLMALYSEKSPDVTTSRKSFQQAFAAVEKIELKGFTISKVTLDGEKATVRVVADMGAVDAATGKPAAGFGKMYRTFHCIKEGGVWKVRRYVTSEEDLAERLVAANTEVERKALLEADKELVTVELQRALVAQGQRLLTQGSYPPAIVMLNLALRVAEQLRDKTGMATALRVIGSIRYLQGDYASALDSFRECLKLAEELQNKSEIARAHNGFGVVYDSRGEYARALEHYQEGLKVAVELGDKTTIARVLNNIGIVHQYQGSYSQALEYFPRSLKLGEELGDQVIIGRSLNNIGLAHRSLGNYGRALEYYQRSLKLAEELGDKADIVRTMNNIGLIHRINGNLALALEQHQRCLKLAEELGSKVQIARSLGNIGLVHFSQGNYSQALECYQKNLKLARELGDSRMVLATLNNIGEIQELQGNYTEALSYYEQNLKLAEDLGDKDGIATTLINIAEVQRSQGSYAKAIELSKRSTDIARQIGDQQRLWEARAIAGKAYRALNQPDQAQQAFADAIDAVEELRSRVAGGEQEHQRFFEGKTLPYYAMVDLLVNQNNPPEALVYSERAKARVLLDVLSGDRVNITKAMTTAEQEQERKLIAEMVSLNTQVYREKVRQQPDESRLADLNTRLQKARLYYEAFQTNLYASHAQLKVQRGESQTLTLKESGSLIPDSNTALLEFAVMEDRTYLFVLTKNKDASQPVPDLKVYTLNINQKDLADLAQRFRHRLAAHDFSTYDLANQLYGLLLKPAQTQLENRTTLVIVPDGLLWEMPFQALQAARNRYLIEDYAISYAPSLTVLREMMKPRMAATQSTTAIPTLLAFGNPAIGKETAERVKSVFMDEQLLPLPEAERQVKTLGQIYGAARSRVYVGTEAREDRAKLEGGNCRILHLATHGILNDASPMYSHLVLSQAQDNLNEDGLLEAWEIMNLDLKADLAVLSGCDTARGRVGAGEGVIGLAWAFFVAGCPTTVASQWKVESAITTELMVELHRNLKPKIEDPKSKISKAEALRQAALKLLKSKQYRHPFYWAGFVMIGDGR